MWEYVVITQQVSIWCEQHGACMESNIVFHWSKDLTLLLYKEKSKQIFVSITMFLFIRLPVTKGKIQKQQKCFPQIYGFSYLSVTE